MGFTDDRRYMWAGALDSNKIFIFDIHSTPAKPKLVKTITDFAEKTGFVGPHTFYALPGRMLIQALSNTKDTAAAPVLVVYNNDGELINTIDMPTGTFNGVYATATATIWHQPQQNVLLTSSFTGWNNYMMDMANWSRTRGDEAFRQDHGDLDARP